MNELFTNNNQAIVSSDRVLYTPSAFARTSLLHLQEIGKLTACRPHTSSRSNLQSFLFFMVVSGSGVLVYDGKEHKLEEGSCVFIDCHYPYSHTTGPDNLWALRWVHFYGPGLSSIYNKYCERGGRPVFSPAEAAPFISTLDSLYQLASSGDYIRDMRINEELNRLCTLLMGESWHLEDKKSAPKRASVSDVKEYLDIHYAEKVVLDELAAKFFIDKYYLTKTFKNQFGLPISTYLQNLRITKAKQLLRFSNKSVEEIGYEVGLGAPAYFSRVFKNVEGVSPKTYREQW
ncbi:MAG: AraC family transcriptional regulator [Bulleidia sp.]|nr:AraC family transcriptional regulator [Bulleidia sp.]